MHVAICDDDIAHRKHFERLMQRESNARTVVNTSLYIDSFGSEKALFHTPMLYDVFFLSIKSEELSVYRLARRLRDMGVLVPIVIVKLESHEYLDGKEISDLYYISDPLKPSELHDMIGIAYQFSLSAVKLYEIHGMHETRYLAEEKMLYADIRNNGKYTLHLIDQTSIDCDMPLEDFYYMMEDNERFVFTGKDAVINVRYLENIAFSKVELKDGVILPISFAEKKVIRSAYEKFIEEESQS